MNEEIRVPQVRLIDQNGEMLGVMSAREALMRAKERLTGDGQMGLLFKVMGLAAPEWPDAVGF